MTVSTTRRKIDPVPRKIPSAGHVEIPHDLWTTFIGGINDFRSRLSPDEVFDRFKTDYLLSEVESKYPLGSSSLDEKTRQAVGLEKLLSANARCKSINEQGYPNESIDSCTLSSLLQVAARKCRMILGDFDYGVYKLSKFTNGSTTCRSFKHRDPYYKYCNSGRPIDVSGRALSRLQALIRSTPVWAENGGCNNISIRNSDKVTFVPKNATEDRAIVPQQAGLVCLQSALGQAIRERLRRVGIDLTNQKTNQELARTCSISRWGATLDLKNASALMNYRIVWDILPIDWFRELDILRNTEGLLPDGSPITWEMFSSMGNGYNFELESLLFYCLASAAVEMQGDFVGTVSVYGDDIIVPLASAPFVCELLETVGFEINRKKTHIVGNFRESCGAHYLNGLDVKPFYVRKGIDTVPDVIRLCNRLRIWASVPGTRMCDPRLFKLWKTLSACVPWYLRGGFDAEDVGALITHERPRYRIQAKTTVKPIHGWRAYCRQMQSSQTALVWDVRINMYIPGDSSAAVDATAVTAMASIDQSVWLVKPNDRQPHHDFPLFDGECYRSDNINVLVRSARQREIRQATGYSIPYWEKYYLDSKPFSKLELL